MSKHNYSQYSSKPKNHHNRPVEKTTKVEPEASKSTVVQETSQVVRPSLVTTPGVVQTKPQLVQETVETVKLPNTVTGKVINCAKLNVRENATVDSGIVCVLDVMSEIEIDVKKSTENWLYIYTAIGAEGYCMKQYVEAYT